MTFQKRAENCIAQGCLTYSKRSDQFVKGVYPTHVTKGEGCFLYDENGKKYIDFIGGLGSNIIDCNNNYSLPTVAEVELAEKVKEKIKFIDKLRFLKTGSEACSAAVRIARAYKQEKRTYEEVLKMWCNEVGNRVPQKSNVEGWVEEQLQRMCSFISSQPKSNRDKENGSKKICKNVEGDIDGKKPFSDKTEKNKNVEKRQDILLCSACERLASTCTRHMQDLWSGSTSSPSRLLKTPFGDLAMPPASCPITQGYGIGTGYHGHHNSFISAEYPGSGCIDEKYIKFNSIKEIVDFIRNSSQVVDYVIVEPVQLDINIKSDLEMLQKACEEFKIVLIFDEVITGFRTPKYCISQYLDVTPDLICLGKAMANGYPISVVGGKKEIMDAPGWFVSSTFAGELSGIMAAHKTIDYLTEKNLSELWKAGEWFQTEFNKMTSKLKMVGIPTKAVFRGDELFKNLFWQEMCKRGYIFGKAWHIMFSHILTNDHEGMSVLNIAINECKQVIKEIESGTVKLEGQMAQEAFKRY